MRRVVVTGMGAVTPIGIGVENFWNSVKEKITGFDKITKFDTTGFKASLAAEIKDFDPKEFMDFKAARRMELFCQDAVAAAAEAMKNAGIDMEKEKRTGFDKITKFDIKGVAGSLGAELKACVTEEAVDLKAERRMELTC